jgi:hypothetical protein
MPTSKMTVMVEETVTLASRLSPKVLKDGYPLSSRRLSGPRTFAYRGPVGFGQICGRKGSIPLIIVRTATSMRCESRLCDGVMRSEKSDNGLRCQCQPHGGGVHRDARPLLRSFSLTSNDR